MPRIASSALHRENLNLKKRKKKIVRLMQNKGDHPFHMYAECSQKLTFLIP